MKRMIAASLLLAISMAAGAAAPLAKIQSMLARPEVLCGRFEQSKQLAGLKKPLLSSGRFCVVKGKGVLWRTLKPFPSTLRVTREEIVHFQGERVAMRLEARKEPVVRMINDVLFSLLGGDLAQLERLFIVDGSVSGDSWNVALAAREPGLAKAVGAFRLDGGAYVEHIAIDEASGDRTAITFSGMQAGEGAMAADEAALLR